MSAERRVFGRTNIPEVSECYTLEQLSEDRAAVGTVTI